MKAQAMEYKFPSMHEMRSRAPFHFLAKANNARYVAYLLTQTGATENLVSTIRGAGYGGNPDIAMSEGFRREAAIALELIVKAVIAIRIEIGVSLAHVTRVRPTHDVPKLWEEASLPMLSKDDQKRLLLVKSLLGWASRYAVPKDEKQYAREQAALDAIDPPPRTDSLRITRPLAFGWEDFDRIYQVALNAFAKLGPQHF